MSSRKPGTVIQRLRPLLFTLLLAMATTTLAENPAENSDEFLAGYVSAILQRDLDLSPQAYNLQVSNREVVIELPEESEHLQADILEALRDIPDIARLQVRVMQPATEIPPGAPIGELLTRLLGFSSARMPFPYGDPFRPLIADPKQPRFFVSALRYRTPTETFAAGSVGYGETFGVYRRLGKKADEGLQVSISGGLFALFNLDAPSHDLINADYSIGLPISYRKDGTSVRLRIYHQSSHLGDEYLLRAQPERVNLSFESLELLFSQDWNHYRGYLGGEVLLRKDPDDLQRWSFHSGVEYRGSRRILDAGQLIAGLDLKSWEENDWYVNKSARIGLEIGNPDPSQRQAALMLEAYQGYAPHGQFYDEKINYYGVGIAISF